MSRQDEHLKQDYMVKLLISSILQLIFFIPWVVMIVVVAKNWAIYGQGISSNPGTYDNLAPDSLPTWVQLERIWLLILTSTMALLWGRCGYLCYRVNTNLLYTTGFFSWVLIPYYIFLCHEVHAYSSYKTDELFDYNNTPSISLKELVYDFKNGSLSKLSKNTIFYLFVLVLFFIGFVFIMIPMIRGARYLDAYWTFNALCYFTHITNILCFIFLLVFPFINTKKICRDNTIQLNLCTYITVVALIYWVALFPSKVSSGAFAEYSLQHQVESIWLHLVTPVFFIAFMCTTTSNNLMYADEKFWQGAGKMIIYPLWYGSFAYALPFMVHESVYGKWTNLNPHAWTFGNLEFVQNGSPWFILTIPVLGIVFLFFYWVYRSINNAIVNNYYQHQETLSYY